MTLIAEPTGVLRGGQLSQTSLFQITTPMNQWMVVAFEVAPTKGTTTIYTDVGSSSGVCVPFNAEPSIASSITVGYTKADYTGRFAHIDIAELEWYDHIFSATELQQVRSDMKTRYGL